MLFVFDTETTGLIDNHIIAVDKQPEVIEFYGCLIDPTTGNIAGEVESFVKPKRLPIPQEITNITNIIDENVAEAPAFFEVWERAEDLMITADAVVAHNLSYDMEVVAIELERIGRHPVWPPFKICTVEQTVHFKGYRLSLQALHELLFGETFKEAHRARTDVQALCRCVCELVKRGDL